MSDQTAEIRDFFDSLKKSDRHKPRTGDRHKPRTGDRHSENYKAKKKENRPRKDWNGEFISFDGEGWNGRYTVFASSKASYDLYDEEGLETATIFNYLLKREHRKGGACVGYGLSYDFENILKDIPVKDFNQLLLGEEIVFEGYTVKYIPRKMLTVSKPSGRYRKNKNGSRGKEYINTVVLQDTISYFQSSFENALKKWKIEIPPIISEFKAERSNFSTIAQTPEGLAKIKKYNREELRLHVELMNKLREADRQAFEAIGLRPNHSPRKWYGPGASASNFLRQTNWIEEHPEFVGDTMEKFRGEVLSYYLHDENGKPSLKGNELADYDNLKQYPFAAAFYGGRIEAAAVGTFKEPLIDYDINSAYPFAIAHLPKWEPKDLREVTGYDIQDRIGIYLVEWACPPNINFYPFPYRSRSGNVFFPRAGSGWYMSPEVSAALATYGPEYIRVKKGYVLAGTDGCGNGLKKLPEEKLCTTAKKMDLMASLRLKAKAAKESKEKSMKLILNSGYGKLIQQIGSHKFLTPLAAAWITSTCRAIISRTIGADKENNIISIMTDGILTRKELPVTLGKNLGEFERADFNYAIQFMPGVYYLENTETGEKISRYRGMDKDFNPQKAVKFLHKKAVEHKGSSTEPGRKAGYYPIELNIFVTRQLAIHQPKKFGEKIYQFVKVKKEEEFSLSSKREPGKKGFRLQKNEEHNFFRPKSPGLEIMTFGGYSSKPYSLNLPVEKPYDEAETEEEILADNRIISAMEYDQYELYEGE